MSEFKDLRISIKKVDNGYILGFMDAKNWQQREEIYFDYHQMFSRLDSLLMELRGNLSLPPAIEHQEEKIDIPF